MPSTLAIAHFGILLLCIYYADGLRCWHCVSDDCDEDPADNYKASKKSCIGPDQACQKVYFEMKEETDRGTAVHISTVRSCSKSCETRNDFANCTYQVHTTRGCVRKDCCRDGDLCNDVTSVHMTSYFVSYVTAFVCLIYAKILDFR